MNSLSPQVFFFSYSRINTQSSAEVVIHEDCLVQVETSDNGESEAIAFHLRNTRSATSSGNASALLNQKPFKYSKTLYLDQLADAKQKRPMEIADQIQN
jgi:hypothetical protein